MKWCFLFLYILGSLVACKKKDTGAIPTRIIESVKYGPDPKQAMDVYLPAGRTIATPVLVLIHGGGWTSGDKADFKPFVDTLRRRLPQYAIFNISYRLANGGVHIFPTQENDVKAAIEFILSKRDEYIISDRMGLLGASAGGHLALLHAYKYVAPVKIKAVVSYFGPTELTQLYNNPPNILVPLLLLNVTGTIPAANPTLYQQASPLTFAVAGSTPTLLIHGGADDVVPFSQSILLRDKLNAVAVPHEFVFYPGKGHGDWDALTFTDSFTKTEAFLKKWHP